MRPSLFSPKSKGVKTSNRPELDLRLEFDTLIYGDKNHIPHGQLVLIRNMRRDPDGYPTKCVCFEVRNTVEADPDCSYCYGEGYYFDENWVTAYSMHLTAADGMARKYIHMAPGLERTDYKVFFIRYNTGMKYEDKVVEVRLDLEGEVVKPYVREAIYKPHTIVRFRSDYGRVEYLGIFCREEDAWKTDNPQ